MPLTNVVCSMKNSYNLIKKQRMVKTLEKFSYFLKNKKDVTSVRMKYVFITEFKLKKF